MLEASFHGDIQATVFRVKGVLVQGELLKFIKQIDPTDRTLLNIYDFREAIWDAGSLTQFRENTIEASHYQRKGMRTAFVFSRDEDYGLGRVLEILAELLGFKATIAALRDINEAREWLTRTE